VYFRQELEVQSGAETLTLFGAAQTVAIPPNQSEPIALASPVSDEVFGVSLFSLGSGSLDAGGSLALAGTTITVTVTPSTGYVLKSGFPKYSTDDDGVEYAISSGPPYTFTMPASDVTVSAEFIKTDPVRYVTETGSGDGLSWVTASGDLQKMMDELGILYNMNLPGPFVVKAGAGTYRPKYKPNADGTSDLATAAGDRDSAFILREGVHLRGGYPASGGDDASRDITANVTTLSGDIGTPGDNTDNAYHVALGLDIAAGSETVLDGLTITGGNANGSGGITVGGKTINRQYGGGMYHDASSLVLTNVSVSGNTANQGGGIYNTNASTALVNMAISGNQANSGGGIYNYKAWTALINVLISGNVSTGSGGAGGGGIYHQEAPSLTLINVTISGNKGTNGGSMKLTSTNPAIRNSIIWGNDNTSIPTMNASPTFSSSNNQGADPVFVDRKDPATYTPMPNSDGDYSLAAGSPAINAGDSSLYPADADAVEALLGDVTLSAEAKTAINAVLAEDLAGNTRIQGTAIDMGAYEKE
jgi:hypothetical protein